VVKKIRGISQQGSASEKSFEKLTNFSRTKNSHLGDFFHSSVYIEVKKVTANQKGSGTINQIRAIKNCVLVIHVINKRYWYVLDSKQVAKMVTKLKTRGQHCENPYECSNLSLGNLLEFGHKPVNNSSLYQETLRAINRTKKEKELKKLSDKMKLDLQKISKKHRLLMSKAID
jgi:hypothetical protein